jgi:hypothetical protein
MFEKHKPADEITGSMHLKSLSKLRKNHFFQIKTNKHPRKLLNFEATIERLYKKVAFIT